MQIEKTPEDDLKEFLDNVKRGYQWLDTFDAMMSQDTQSKEGSNSESENEDKNVDLEDQVQQQGKIIIINTNNEVIQTKFPFRELSSKKCPSLERKMFARVFEYKEENGIHFIKNKHRNGFGLYSLASELFSFRMLLTKKITNASNAFDILNYQTCDKEDNFQEVCNNFWVNFATSFLYMICFNTLVLLGYFDRMRTEYITGKNLKKVSSVIDILKLAKMDELCNLLDAYDEYGDLQDKPITPELYSIYKDKIVDYAELLGIIEENISFFAEQRINTSYINFILCTSFAQEHFNTTSGTLSEQTPSHIASIKVIFDRYYEEIMNYAMDHFKVYIPISNVRNSFFYHWRTLLGYVIPQKNHMLNEMFDDKLHARLTKSFDKYHEEFQKFYEVNRGKNAKERKIWGERIRDNVDRCKNLGLLAINVPCNAQNRYTQVRLIAKVEEIENEFANIQKAFKGFH